MPSCSFGASREECGCTDCRDTGFTMNHLCFPTDSVVTITVATKSTKNAPKIKQVKKVKKHKFDDTIVNIGRYKNKGKTLGHIRLNRPDYYQFMIDTGFVDATTGQYSEKRKFENLFEFDVDE